MDEATVRARVREMMPALLKDLRRMVAVPSCAFPGYPAEPVEEMARLGLELFRASGFTDVRLLDVPSGYPPIFAEVPGPAGAPTVMLYAHYDVQPALPEQGWSTDPWTATRGSNGRIYGRGAADDKSGMLIHMGAMRALEGRPPCTVKLIVEGMEETNSNLEAFVEADPDLFACDAFLVCDMGNLEVGSPSLTTTLRGEVSCTVRVRTLEHPLHSGVFGGPVPDAVMALVHLLSSLQDDEGNVAVAGVTSFEHQGPELPEDGLRSGADMPSSVRLIGSGDLSSRLWTHPSISAIGVDAVSIADSSNVLHAEAAARVSMRIVPGTDPEAELDALVHHLETHAPWGAEVEVERIKAAPPFAARTDGPIHAAARGAMEAAFGQGASEVGSGASIPLLQTLAEAVPGAEFILWGAEDVAESRIHSSDESVDPSEIERMIVAEALLMAALTDV